MSNTTQIKTRDAYGVTYADPADTDFTVRFKTTTANKTLAGQTVQNNVSEIIVNDIVTAAVGSAQVTDNVSVRIRVSGSRLSDARKSAILKSVAAQLPAWADQHVLSGFDPVTAPVNPA